MCSAPLQGWARPHLAPAPGAGAEGGTMQCAQGKDALLGPDPSFFGGKLWRAQLGSTQESSMSWLLCQVWREVQAAHCLAWAPLLQGGWADPPGSWEFCCYSGKAMSAPVEALAPPSFPSFLPVVVGVPAQERSTAPALSTVLAPAPAPAPACRGKGSHSFTAGQHPPSGSAMAASPCQQLPASGLAPTHAAR